MAVTMAQLQESTSSMTNNMQQLRTASNADGAFRTLVEMEDASVRVAEALTVAIETLSNATSAIGQRMNVYEQKGLNASSRKPLAESRCVTGL